MARRLFAALFFIMALGLVLPLSVSAQTVVDGIKAQEQKDYKKALEIFEKLARAGNVEAMFDLAKMVQAGYGIDKPDPAAALAWYKLAADTDPSRGDPAFHVGILLIRGEGVKEDPATAYEYFVRAAKANHIDAQYNAGVMKYEAIGIPEDKIEGTMWFMLSARVGYPPAIAAREKAFGELKPPQLEMAQKKANAMIEEINKNEKARTAASGAKSPSSPTSTQATPSSTRQPAAKPK
ncbi:MAG: tetratricopeptide repeat protein [Alphaproteobacteria bacterium]